MVNDSFVDEQNSSFSLPKSNHTNVRKENYPINFVAEHEETTKWEHLSDLRGKTPIRIKLESDLNESQSDDTNSTTSSENSSKMHLIESVEILTHPAHNMVHIQKVDINQLKIKEKPNKNDLDPKSRFRVNFKQEELVDLRSNDDERLDLATNKVFAKKFVEQIIKLSSSKLENHLLFENGLNEHVKLNDNNLNLNNITNKTTSEILESLTNLKCDIGKHFTDSLVLNSDNIVMGEQCYNLNLVDDYDTTEDFSRISRIDYTRRRIMIK